MPSELVSGVSAGGASMRRALATGSQRSFRHVCLRPFSGTKLVDVEAPESDSSSVGALARERVGMYAELSKARLSALVVVTAGAGYGAGVGPLDPITFASLAAGKVLCVYRQQCGSSPVFALHCRDFSRGRVSQHIQPVDRAGEG